MAKRRGSAVEGGGSSRGEFWARHIAACEASGVTIAQYCRDHELSYAGYQWWKGELKRRALPTVFAEVRLPAAANIVDGAIEWSWAGAVLSGSIRDSMRQRCLAWSRCLSKRRAESSGVSSGVRVSGAGGHAPVV